MILPLISQPKTASIKIKKLLKIKMIIIIMIRIIIIILIYLYNNNNNRILISYFYVDGENYLPEGNNFLFNPKTTLFREGDNFTIHI